MENYTWVLLKFILSFWEFGPCFQGQSHFQQNQDMNLKSLIQFQERNTSD